MEHKIKAFIIDDDKGARQILQKYLEISGKVDVVENLSDTQNALVLIRRKKPDVVFLDINMPIENGLLFAGRLRAVNPSIPIVFTTAYKNFAFPAFKISPIDYLVKPFGVDEIFDVIKLIEEHIENEALKKCVSSIWGNSIPNKIKLKINGGYVFFNCSDIIYITSVHNMVEVFLTDGTREKAFTNLSELYLVLKHQNFFRINRAAIVNIDHIKRIDKKLRKCIVDFDGKEVEFPFAISIFGKFEEMKSIKLS